ncbi:hypothetical protein [Bradyrhizobium sp. 145]|uniref:hypothetical protein n=1 Tax=Bradyrhizobium sp. 145 TaxID=2782621 RepID=UPI001FFBAF85|nr:hypothetical protein [Bradyrhizobium sp. 145]MCK1686459.1 hypothetical protein [Bradyrhizobium sp. 145]
MTANGKILEVAQHGLSQLASVKCVHDGIVATTHCMYPSNGLVQVTVRGGEETIVASDEGGAFGEALSAGIAVKDYDRSLARLVKDHGLILKAGIIHTKPVPIAAAPLAIVLVANASQEVARWLYDHVKIKRTRDFKALLSDFLEKRFDDRVHHNAPVVGNSNKQHRFANVIDLDHERRLIIDPVSNDASSVNARVVANLDVQAMGDPRIIQRIVFDDEDDWSPEDLNLLQVGAVPVPFSRVGEVIERLAAA